MKPGDHRTRQIVHRLGDSTLVRVTVDQQDGAAIPPPTPDYELPKWPGPPTSYSPGINQFTVVVFDELAAGDHGRARKAVASCLRDGIVPQEILNIAAYLLDPPKNKRGRPKVRVPKLHALIAQAYQGLRDEGVRPRPERINCLAKIFKMSGRSIETTLAFARKQARVAGLSPDDAREYYQKSAIRNEYVPAHYLELWKQFGPEGGDAWAQAEEKRVAKLLARVQAEAKLTRK